MTRKQLFEAPLPATKEDAIAWLRNLKRLGLMYHLDDNPADIIRSRRGISTFRPHEIPYLQQFVDRLNELFADDGPEEDRDTINAGAWTAAQRAGWLDDLGESSSVEQRIDRLFESPV